jgi:hypothetical protein
MVRLMTGVRVGVVTLLAVVLLNTIGVFSLGDVSAAGEAGISKVPSLFKDKGGKDGGNGGGNGNGNSGNNGNGGGNGNVSTDEAESSEDDDADEGDDKSKKDKKDKKDKSDKQDGAEDDADDSDEDDGDDSDSDKNPQSGNVDCDDVEGMIEYLMHRNMNGAVHANENGADNAALGALNKCADHGDEDESDFTDGTPVDEASPVTDAATPVGEDDSDEDNSDNSVAVKVDIDEDGNGIIEYDLDGDGEVDLTMIVEDGVVVEYVEAGVDDATPEASPEAA